MVSVSLHHCSKRELDLSLHGLYSHATKMNIEFGCEGKWMESSVRPKNFTTVRNNASESRHSFCNFDKDHSAIQELQKVQRTWHNSTWTKSSADRLISRRSFKKQKNWCRRRQWRSADAAGCGSHRRSHRPGEAFVRRRRWRSGRPRGWCRSIRKQQTGLTRRSGVENLWRSGNLIW